MILPAYRGPKEELKAGKDLQDKIAALYLELAYPQEDHIVLDTRGPRVAYDFLLINQPGLPVEALEVKARRCRVGEYPTAMFTYSKHEQSRLLYEEHGIRTVGVSLYSDGLGVCDLTEPPVEIKWFQRWGHHRKKAKHGLWQEGRQWKVEGEADES